MVEMYQYLGVMIVFPSLLLNGLIVIHRHLNTHFQHKEGVNDRKRTNQTLLLFFSTNKEEKLQRLPGDTGAKM